MGLQHFFVGNRHLGSRRIENFRRPEDCLFGVARIHDSYAYFCPKCGEIWGRLFHEGAPYTQCMIQFCPDHGDGRLAKDGRRGDPLAVSLDWPREALLHELQAELRMAEQ